MGKFIFVYFLLMICATVHAQENSVASGGDAQSNGGSVSYSIGQVFTTTSTGSSGSVIQGVQQPYEISVVSFIEESNGIYLMASVYPNPTQDILTLSTENFEQKNMLYQLYDINGSLLETNIVKDSETKIELNAYNFSIYFLKLISNNKEIKTFKIIKN